MYYALSTTIERMFGGDNPLPPGTPSNALSAISFILLTDESIFTDDTLKDVGKLSNADSKWYCPWFAAWQSSPNNTHKFPTTGNWDSYVVSERREVCKKITEAMKQMSYYYGVNINWGLYGGLAMSSDAKAITDQYNKRTGALEASGTAFWLNKVVSLDPQAGEISYIDDSPAWEVPKDFHVDYPHDRMCRVWLDISPSYIQDGRNALNDTVVMRDEHQYDSVEVLNRFHYNSRNEYNAYRFLRLGYTSTGQQYTLPDEPVTLPSTVNMNLVPGTYHWETTDLRPGMTPTQVACGGTYQVNYNDHISDDSQDVIHFVLVKDT